MTEINQLPGATSPLPTDLFPGQPAGLSTAPTAAYTAPQILEAANANGAPGRTVTISSDAILSSDQGSIVTYDSATTVMVTLSASAGIVACDVVSVGIGNATLVAASGATINSGNYLGLSQKTLYRVAMAYNAGSAAQWFVK